MKKILLLILLIIPFYINYKTIETKTTYNEHRQIEYLIISFGEKLKNVSLLAPTYILKETMIKNYEEYVSRDLIDKWIKDPLNAPGRITSSPWPERIEIMSINKINNKNYEVMGLIIELSSVEKIKGGVVAKRIILLNVVKLNDEFIINEVRLGNYF